MTINTLVLDLDGTLADTVRDLIPALNHVTAAHGLAPVSTGEVGHVVGHGARSMIARAFALREKKLPPELHNQLVDIFLAEYEQNLSLNTVLFDGAEAALDTFSAAGWRVAVCTNKPEYLAKMLLDQLNVASRFAAITGGDTFHFRKPDPRHLIETIQLCGGTVENAIMVGDSETDILTAKAASVPIVAVDFGYSHQPVTNFGPDGLISHFDELPDMVNKLQRQPT